MRVYVIGLRNSYSIGEEPYITQPYPHADFIQELTKRYEMMETELGVPFRRKEEVLKIEDINEDFLLAQPTGKKTYINSMSCSRYYLFFIPYEILDSDLVLGKELSHKTQLYNLGWLIEERQSELSMFLAQKNKKSHDSNQETQENPHENPIIIRSDPLTTVLRIKTLGNGEPGTNTGFTLQNLHGITSECVIYTFPDKWYRIQKILMAVPE